MNEDFHEPVLTQEVLEYLAPKPGRTYIDGTLGHGGHTIEILKMMGGEGLVVGIDQNTRALETARRRIDATPTVPAANVRLVQGNFADLIPHLQLAQAPPLGGILLDLGPSTPQLLDPELGMSWESETALDMRLDRDPEKVSAEEIVNYWTEDELTRLFRDYAQEKWSRRIARRIVETRKTRPIRTGKELGDLVKGAIPRKAWPPKIHPATRVFLALRMEVNRELENVGRALPAAFERLPPGGRLVVISFHSGEDRLVKRFFQEMAKPEKEVPWPLPQRDFEGKPRMRVLTKRPVRATEEEIERNPRSRSALLRAAEKL